MRRHGLRVHWQGWVMILVVGCIALVAMKLINDALGRQWGLVVVLPPALVVALPLRRVGERRGWLSARDEVADGDL